jgi:hypothetical protein
VIYVAFPRVVTTITTRTDNFSTLCLITYEASYSSDCAASGRLRIGQADHRRRLEDGFAMGLREHVPSELHFFESARSEKGRNHRAGHAALVHGIAAEF